MTKLVLIALSLLAACTASSPSPDAGLATEDTKVASGDDLGTDAGADLGATCTDVLYGRPNENTGLSAAECGPSCGCGEPYEARVFSDTELDAWLSWPGPALAELTADPYETEPAAPVEGQVCALQFTDGAYLTMTFDSREAAEAAGASLTHKGACGLCSTLQDLVAYIRNPDLTEPVRQCGIEGIRNGEEAALACVEALGFTRPCAQIWAYNATHTRKNCLEPCILALRDPYHLPDGGLNDCLACDEELSGPVFKSVAGRTRRNSGLASAICRPCDTVARIPHEYPSP